MNVTAPTPPPTFLSTTRAALTRGLRPLIAFEMVFRLLLVLAIGPLSVSVLNALVRQSGQPAITNFGLISFLFTPLGLFTVVLGLTVGFLLTALESAGLLLILVRTTRGLPVSSRQTFYVTAARLPTLFNVAAWQVLYALAVALPFAATAWLTWRVLLSGSDINYYLAHRPAEFYLAGGIGAVLAAGLGLCLGLLYLRWLFAVPVVLFEGKKGRAALRASGALVSGQFWLVVRRLLAWMVLRTALTPLVLLGVDALNRLLLAHPMAPAELLLWTVICLVLSGAILFAFAAMDSLGFAIVVAVTYQELHRRRGATLPEEQLQVALTPKPTTIAYRLAAWVGIGLLVSGAIGHAALLAGTFAHRKPVLITAHRAGALKAPENTLAALRLAIAAEADFAEIDVQHTRDGVVVVLHDEDLRRLTGDRRKLRDMTWEEARRLDVGSRVGPGFRGERLATLEEFLEAASGHIKLNIELKYTGQQKQLTERVIELVRQYDMIDRVVIMSLTASDVIEVRRREPRLKVGVIVEAELGDLMKADVDFFAVHHPRVTVRLREETALRGKELFAWTVNRRQDIEKMLDLDVDNLITDDPELARQVIEERRGLGDAELILRRLHRWLRS